MVPPVAPIKIGSEKAVEQQAYILSPRTLKKIESKQKMQQNAASGGISGIETVRPNWKCISTLACGYCLVLVIIVSTVFTERPHLQGSASYEKKIKSRDTKNVNSTEEAIIPTVGPSQDTEEESTFHRPENEEAKTVVEKYGRLKYIGNQLYSEKTHESVQLAGMSLFWSNSGWGGEQYYSNKGVKELVEKWGCSLVRAAMGVEDEGGYIDLPTTNMNRIKKVIQAALDFGIYIIIDWHSHYAELYEAEAITFFSEISTLYGTFPNIIYEIYNEPLLSSWSTVKHYAETIIPIIRQGGSPHSLIIIGTTFYSQNVDLVIPQPLDLTLYGNIGYTLHFYAASHGAQLRQKAILALDSNIPIFVTEFGTVPADGDGDVDQHSLQEWLSFLYAYNISFCNWAFNDKDESASALKPNTDIWKLPWTYPDVLTTSGRLIFDIIQKNALSHGIFSLS